MIPTVKPTSVRTLTRLTYMGSSSTKVKVKISETQIVIPTAITITSTVLSFPNNLTREMFIRAHLTKARTRTRKDEVPYVRVRTTPRGATLVHLTPKSFLLNVALTIPPLTSAANVRHRPRGIPIPRATGRPAGQSAWMLDAGGGARRPGSHL